MSDMSDNLSDNLSDMSNNPSNITLMNISDDIIQLIKNQGEIRSKDIQIKFNISSKQANRLLNKLIKQGLIKAIGKNKGRKYILK